MMRTLIAITVIVLLPLSWTVSQDSLLVARTTLEKVASKLDSFDLCKLREMEYISWQESCNEIVDEQKKIISAQDTAINNMELELMKMSDVEIQYQNSLKANTDYIKELEKQNKGVKLRNKIYLIGGGVLTVGLTTALLITLLR